MRDIKLAQRSTFKAPQGLLRSVVLAYASRYPVTGAEIAEDVRSKTNGLWDPSPGSLYFLVNELKGKGLLVTVKGEDPGRKAYIATEKGRAELAGVSQGLLGALEREVSLLALLASMLDPSSSVRTDILKWALKADPAQLQKLRPQLR